MHGLGRIAWLTLACPLLNLTQTAARLVVTIGRHYGHEPPVLTRGDLTIVRPEYRQLPIASLVPLRGNRASLELFVLVDSCSSCEAGTRFQELSRFIGSQPTTTAPGVAYIDNGRLRVAETPMQDHERAVKALNAPGEATRLIGMAH